MPPEHTGAIDLNSVTPLYYQVYLSVRDRIISGEFAPGDMIPTERKLCEEFGVSRITVIKGLDILESEGLIDRQQGRGTFVTEYAGRDGRDTSQDVMVAFVCSGIATVPQVDMLVGVARTLAERHISLLVLISEHSCDAEVECIERALARGADGIIVYPCGDFANAEYFQELVTRGVPVVMTDRYYPGVDVDYVVNDDWKGGFGLTERLIERGHKRIAFGTGDEVLPTSVRDRLAGYKAALEEHGLPYDENLVWTSLTHQTHPLADHGLQVLSDKRFNDNLSTERPTGLVAANYGVAKFLREKIFKEPLEVDIPAGYVETIEIATFYDGTQVWEEPYISYLAWQPGEPIGVAAAETMVDRLNKDLQPAPQHIALPIEIVDLRVREQGVAENI
jgi:DNA-binding LacI/PurR family transcriptional regulator